MNSDEIPLILLVPGVLPPAISAFFGFFLPKIMRSLSKYQGDVSLTSFVVKQNIRILTLISFIAYPLPPGPCSHGPLFWFPDHLSVHHLHPHRRVLSYVKMCALFLAPLLYLSFLAECISLIILEIGQHKSVSEIFSNFRSKLLALLLRKLAIDGYLPDSELPGQIQNTYIIQSSYWLTFFP